MGKFARINDSRISRVSALLTVIVGAGVEDLAKWNVCNEIGLIIARRIVGGQSSISGCDERGDSGMTFL